MWPVGRLGTLAALPLTPLLAFGGVGSGGAEPGGIRVTAEPGGSSAVVVEARHASLAQVLDALALKTGTRLHYPALPRGPVDAKCAEESLNRVLACVLGFRPNLVARYAGAAGQGRRAGWPAEVWILASSFDRAPRAGEAGDAEAALPAKARNHTESPRSTDLPPFEPEEPGKLLGLAAGADAAGRATAIADLAADERADPATVLRVLRDALSDASAEVRAQAVYGLSQRAGAETPELLRAALRDRDADVRLMAVDSAAVDQASLPVFQEALADRDSTVRTLAAEKLASLLRPGGRSE